MKQVICKHCKAVDSHFSFQCNTQRKPIKSKSLIEQAGEHLESIANSQHKIRKHIASLKQNKPLQSPKKQKSISPISNKRKEALKRYRRLRDKYFLEHPICEFPECTSTNITLHHSRGRIGSFLTDKRFFKSLCIKHHRFVEENPEEAQRLGLSKKRLEK